jgi:hypothetical protein
VNGNSDFSRTTVTLNDLEVFLINLKQVFPISDSLTSQIDPRHSGQLLLTSMQINPMSTIQLEQ